MKKIRHYLPSLLILCSIVAGFVVVLHSLQSASAQTTDVQQSECLTPTQTYYDALYKAPPDTYDIYVKLGKRGQAGPVNLHVAEAEESKCLSVGSTQANGETWQKLGTWTSPTDELARFQLSSPLFDGALDANRPTIMLIPQANPVCVPTTVCEYTVGQEKGFIEPTGTLLSENDLRVTRITNPANDKLVRVDYYAGGQFLYSKPDLQPFDMRYVPGGQQTLSRVMQYESGQQVILQQPVYVSFTSDFKNLLFRLVNSNKIGLQIVGILTILAISVSIVLAIIHALHRRHIWKLTHGLIQEPKPQTAVNYPNGVPPDHFLSPQAPAVVIAKRGLPVLLILVGVFIFFSTLDTYVIQFFRVDGPSMENTMQTDQRLLVNKLPKTWAAINHTEYVPQRGEVIVFKKAQSSLFQSFDEEGEGDIYVVKRVIGLPGERVVVKDGKITIYNKDQPEGFDPDSTGAWNKTMVAGNQEDLDVTLSQGEIFVSGDNRPESLDSRANGAVKLQDIVGKVEARVLPFSSRRTF